jgi:hypothetical protein
MNKTINLITKKVIKKNKNSASLAAIASTMYNSEIYILDVKKLCFRNETFIVDSTFSILFFFVEQAFC